MNEEDNFDEGPGIIPPFCKGCGLFYSYMDLYDPDPEFRAEMVNGEFVCASCLKSYDRKHRRDVIQKEN